MGSECMGKSTDPYGLWGSLLGSPLTEYTHCTCRDHRGPRTDYSGYYSRYIQVQ